MFRDHAMIAINTTHSMIIGGLVDPDGIWGGDVVIIHGTSIMEGERPYAVNFTFFYDHGNQKWIDGPRLIQVRSGHRVGIVNDQVTMANLVIVTGGVSSGVSSGYSTEILVDSKWLQGKKRHNVTIRFTSFKIARK